MQLGALAGKSASAAVLVNVPRLVTAHYNGAEDPTAPSQREAVGTSGQRGSSFVLAFNELRILAITHEICLNRKSKSVVGPLYLGIDKNGISVPACATAVEAQATRPSRTENFYKIYTGSFQGADPLNRMLDEAQQIANHATVRAGNSRTDFKGK